MSGNVCWIEFVDYEAADDGLRRAYQAVLGANGQLENLYRAFSLRPQVIKPADELYRAVLHDGSNALPKWFSELIGTYVAILTGCDYAVAHHSHNFGCLLGNPRRAAELLRCLRAGELESCGEEKEVAALRYANKLCLAPDQMTRSDVEDLGALGWSDGEILEIAQIVAMFSYFVRVINGVGISLDGERIGLY